MLLALDVGSTITHVAVFDRDRVVQYLTVPSGDDAAGQLHLARAPSLLRLEPATISAIAVASVVPALRPALAELCKQQFGRAPEFVKEELPAPLPVRYDPPESAGADRLANGVAARERWGAPAVVFDFGTATTVDVVARDGAFVGGMILPGADL